ncbi:MAG: hypothetical protein GW779_04175, partial [Candidatus Altiarchaeum hamiconexum]|nr:hypothetical protein [Candidatus Altarchaeum hamiconexum]
MFQTFCYLVSFGNVKNFYGFEHPIASFGDLKLLTKFKIRLKIFGISI